MKKAIGLAAIAALIGTSAWAAKAPPPAPAQQTPSWTGFYVGGNAGGAWGSFDPQSWTPDVPGLFIPGDVSIFNAAGMSQSIKPSGFTGGFEAGYNWQFNSVVLGIEGDIEALSLKGSSTVNGTLEGAPGPAFTMSSSASSTWLATTRGRLGFAANNWLVYATGGAAFTTQKASFGFIDGDGNTEAAALSTTKAGYTVGGGVEAAFWERWSVKAEYLYVDFSRVATTGVLLLPGVPPETQAVFNSIDLKANIVRLGLNYRFN